ncbi:MAG: amidotransferase [Bacteroidota bacterium]
MKIGLLLCDQVDEAYVSLGGGYPEMFRKWLPHHELIDFQTYEGDFPAQIADCDAYVVSGSRYSVYDEKDWIDQLKEFVQEVYDADQKYVGICFGHQMLAHALGGEVDQVEWGWCVGVHAFEITKPKDWMQPAKSTVNLLMSCQDQVLKLPDNGQVLARSEDCPAAMIQVGRHMLGIQAHPEFPKPYSKALMEDRISRIGEEKVAQGLKSLELDIHPSLVRSWVTQFLQ